MINNCANKYDASDALYDASYDALRPVVTGI